MRVIGLTGGVGAGKSLILSILENEYGAEVIKADNVAKEVMKPGMEGYDRMVEAFGEHILQSDGFIDKTILSGYIFQDNTAKDRVDKIIHPLVWKDIRKKISSSQAEIIVVEFAIMGEKSDIGYDELWYVSASEETRIRRLLENRGYQKEYSKNIIESQASDSEYLDRCDRVIRNDGSMEEIRNQLAEILNSKG